MSSFIDMVLQITELDLDDVGHHNYATPGSGESNVHPEEHSPVRMTQFWFVSTSLGAQVLILS